MHYKIKLILFFTTIILITSSNARITRNKTFLKFGSTGQDQVLQKNMTSYFIHENKLKHDKKAPYSPNEMKNKYAYNNFFISTSVFYMQSDNSTALAKYFFPNGKTELTVKGYGAVFDENDNQISSSPDIFAEWLGIPSSEEMDAPTKHTFSSKIKISPKMEKIGTTIHIHKVIAKSFWISLFFPFEEVKTSTNLQEYDITKNRNISKEPESGSLYFEEPLTATEAFVHPLMKYGKIDNKTHRLSGLADINLKAGFTKKYNNKITFDFYANVIFPTSHKPTAEYLFEPIIGNAKHWGTGFGSNLNVNLNEKLTFISSFDYQYFFRNEEKRSFDLKQNGPWSRYMAATLNLPRTRPERLINYLTLDADVTPGSVTNFLFAIHGKTGSFNLEIGTNVESRSTEKVRFKKEIEKNVGIAWYNEDEADSLLYEFDDPKQVFQFTNSNGKINNSMTINKDNADSHFVSIKNSDINISSATSQNSLLLKLYSTFGVHGKLNKKPFLLNIGGNYNIPANRKELESWNIWGQINISI